MAEPFQSFQSSENLENQFASAASFGNMGFPWRMFLFALFIFGFTLFIYFGLRFGYTSYLSLRSSGIDKEIENLSRKINKTEQASLVTFYSQLVNLEEELGTHGFVSNVFSFLEKNTAQDIYFVGANFSANDSILKLRGRTKVLETVVGQLAALDKAAELLNVTLDSVGFDNFEVAFDLTLKFKKSFFEKIE